jgi:DNA topoisomerase-3
VGKTLVICEKRSVADDVARALGGRFASEATYLEGDDLVVTWAVGHLAELADPEVYDERFKRWRMDDLPIVPERFQVVPRAEGASAKEQLKAIRKLVQRADVERLVNACDAGREGELIFAYALELAAPSELPVERAWFSSMTRTAIRDAFAHLRPGDELRPLEDAARSRSEADWLVGINATRAATVKARALGGTITLGRVQTPTLALMVRREKEIEAFEPVEYWIVDAAFEPAAASARYLGRWFRGSESRLPDEASAVAIAERVRDRAGHVGELRTREQRQIAPLLYDLTALQREAAQWHGFTAQRTLRAAQECYEKAVLTYPRTSSRYLSSDQVEGLQEIAAHVGRASVDYQEAAAYVVGLDELPLERVIDDAKVTDHHALVPTNAKHHLPGLGDDARRVYDMVARRFLAAFFPPAVFESTTVITEIENETFRSRGRVLIEAGWRAAYGELPSDDARARDAGDGADDEGAEQELPRLREDEPVHCPRAESQRRETKPPPRLGEASLLAAMEGAGKLIDDDALREAIKDSGLGTPATRAATIERLIEVGYVVRDGRSLRPTQKGIQVVDLLGDHVLTSPELTGAWEKRLVEMERGTERRELFMRDVAELAGEIVAFLRELPPERTRFPRRDLEIVCPRCGKGTLIENRKGYGCSTWKSPDEPGCGFVIWKTIAGKPITEEIVRELVANGRTRELPGFRSRAGKPFRAMLVLDPQDEQPVRFEFKRPRAGAPALEDHREHDPEGQRPDGEGGGGAAAIALPHDVSGSEQQERGGQADPDEVGQAE